MTVWWLSYHRIPYFVTNTHAKVIIFIVSRFLLSCFGWLKDWWKSRWVERILMTSLNLFFMYFSFKKSKPHEDEREMSCCSGSCSMIHVLFYTRSKWLDINICYIESRERREKDKTIHTPTTTTTTGTGSER